MIGLVITLLLAPQAALADSHEAEQQRVALPAPTREAFTGEIEYEFDSVLNQTTATFVAPLGKRDLLHRIFATPTVHTIVVSYRFNGRVPSHLPDTIRVRLESDGYSDSIFADRFAMPTERTLAIGVGERVAQYSLSISQQGDSGMGPGATAANTAFVPDQQRFVLQIPAQQARIRRRATAWLSACDFLVMIDQSEIRGTVGGLDFEVNHSVVAGLNRFAAEMLSPEAERFIDCARK